MKGEGGGVTLTPPLPEKTTLKKPSFIRVKIICCKVSKTYIKEISLFLWQFYSRNFSLNIFSDGKRTLEIKKNLKAALPYLGSTSRRAAVTWNLPNICLIFVSYKMKIELDCPWYQQMHWLVSAEVMQKISMLYLMVEIFMHLVVV